MLTPGVALVHTAPMQSVSATAPPGAVRDANGDAVRLRYHLCGRETEKKREARSYPGTNSSSTSIWTARLAFHERITAPISPGVRRWCRPPCELTAV